MQNGYIGGDMDYEGRCLNCDHKFNPNSRDVLMKNRKWCGQWCRNQFTKKMHYLVSRRLIEREEV